MNSETDGGASGMPPKASEGERFDRLWLALAALITVFFLFVPLLLVFRYDTQTVSLAPGAASTATVGLIVIVRATARRMLTSVASNVLRTTFATVTRASARTFMRRLVRITVRTLFAAIARRQSEAPTREASEGRDRRSAFRPLAIGFIGLAASFRGLLWVVGDDIADQAVGGLDPNWMSLLAALPLLVYGTYTHFAARHHGVGVRFNSAADGLLLQAYFTGAGSFLPMTTDIEYEGSIPAKMRVAIWALGGMLLTHLALLAASYLTGAYPLSFLAGMFIIYAFVYAFPISPLEGYDIWVHSRLFWVLVFLPILAAFLIDLPDALVNLL